MIASTKSEGVADMKLEGMVPALANGPSNGGLLMQITFAAGVVQAVATVRLEAIVAGRLFRAPHSPRFWMSVVAGPPSTPFPAATSIAPESAALSAADCPIRKTEYVRPRSMPSPAIPITGSRIIANIVRHQ